MVNKHYKSGFSIAELSIVIIIIGIILSGIVGGKKLVNLASLQNARALSDSSPVKGIENLVLWLDSTAKNAFPDGESIDGVAITTWKDLNPQSVKKIDFTSFNSPLYTEDAINSLPGVYLDGVDQYLRSATFLDSLVGNNYVVFVVSDATTGGYILGHGTQDGQITINQSSSTVGATHGGSLGITTSTSVNGLNPIIIVHEHDSTNGNFNYINGDANGVGSAISNLAVADITPYQYIGRRHVLYFAGYVGEIIVFNRLIGQEKRQAVEKYLSKKWKIKITQ